MAADSVGPVEDRSHFLLCPAVTWGLSPGDGFTWARGLCLPAGSGQWEALAGDWRPRGKRRWGHLFCLHLQLNSSLRLTFRLRVTVVACCSWSLGLHFIPLILPASLLFKSLQKLLFSQVATGNTDTHQHF